MSQSFELRIIEDGTHSSDHSCLIGLRFDMADGYQEHMLNKTDLMNLRREIGRTLKELDKPAEQEKPLPEEPQEKGYYLAANDGRLFYKDSDDDWSAVSAGCFWNNGFTYAKWPLVCATLPPEAFPFKRVKTGDGDDD